MDLGFLNVTIMSLLINGLVALNISSTGQYLEIISFIGAKMLMSLSTKRLIDGQNNDTFSTSILKLTNDKKVSMVKYFTNDGLLHKVVRKDDKAFHTLVVSQTFSRYVIHV